MSKRRKYSTEFKREAVELTRMEGVSVSQIAKDLGIGADMLSRWRRELAADGNKAFGVNFDKEVVSRVTGISSCTGS
jgi:transposase